MLYFGLVVFFCILLVAGLAVDFMRYENNRMRVQATADRASLAAATLRETGDREALVRAYFEAAGLTQYLHDVQITEGLNSATVRVETRPAIDTMFMRWVGVNQFNSQEVSVAREETQQMEIVLVLDISGSMRWIDSGGMARIERLRGAAKDFVSQVLAASPPDTVTISIVPYAGIVNPGEFVFTALGGQAWHDYSHCPDLPRSVFNSTALPDASTMPQTAHFMNWTIDAPTMDWGWCPIEANSIFYHSSSEEDLHDYLDTLRLHDGTGTHYGMRWGISLLDPSGRWLTEAMADAGRIAPIHADRPSEWDNPESLKIIVLMTDGMITEQMRPRRAIPNEIFGRNGFYPTPEQQEVLNTIEINNLDNSWRRQITARNQNVADFFSACDLAKGNGVVVYTIAFETNQQGQDEMRACATSPGHYFNALGLQLETAFSAIATSIRSLRLIQ